MKNPDANIEQLLACMDTTSNTLGFVELFRAQGNSFPSLYPGLTIEQFEEAAHATLRDANDLIFRIGGIPVKLLTETGEPKEGVITGLRGYENGVWQSMFLAHGTQAATPVASSTAVLRELYEASQENPNLG